MKKSIVFCLLLSFTAGIVTPSYASLVNPGTAVPDAKTVKTALAEFKNLSRKEKKDRIREAKKTWSLYNKEMKSGKSGKKVEEVVLILLAILLPPLAVYLHQGEVNGKFWISLLLWFLFILPGIIYAILVVTDNA